MSTVPWRRSRKRAMTVLDLPYVERTVGVEAALCLPSVMVLVIEDLCAQVAHEDWQRREPPRWRPAARHHWCGEGQQLRAKKDRLKELAAQCLDSPE
ncbi:hypothetical protein [Streptomyces sp. NPDC046909]|uniref:hypothetical protein n=1 Tax=Streptomyces sp. NPDC046909 TaxID=3155617 RepID=UPI0034110E7C